MFSLRNIYSAGVQNPVHLCTIFLLTIIFFLLSGWWVWGSCPKAKRLKNARPMDEGLTGPSGLKNMNSKLTHNLDMEVIVDRAWTFALSHSHFPQYDPLVSPLGNRFIASQPRGQVLGSILYLGQACKFKLVNRKKQTSFSLLSTISIFKEELGFAYTGPYHAHYNSFVYHYKRMNQRSKEIYKHPLLCSSGHTVRIQLNHCDPPNASMVKHNKHASSTKQRIVQHHVCHMAFSYQNEMFSYCEANLITTIHNDPKLYVDQIRYIYCFFSSAFLGWKKGHIHSIRTYINY